MRNKLRLLLAMRSIFFLLASVLLYTILSRSFHEISRWWTITVTVGNIATLLVLWLICRRQGTTFARFINYEKGKTRGKTIIFVVLIMIATGMGGMQLAGIICYGELPYFPVMMIQAIPLWIAVTIIFLLPLTTTLAEDGVYLGVINQDNSKSMVVFSALFYAIQHSFIPFLPDIRFVLYRFLSFLPLAVIMCFWYRKNRNPLPFMVGHFVLNLATVAQIVMISVNPEIFQLP